MGEFVKVITEGTKAYTVFSKQSFRKLLSLDKELPLYSFYAEGRDVCKEVYLDSPNNLLASAGIILSKVVEENRAYFKVQRENLTESRSMVIREEKVFIHNIGIKDTVKDHALFLIDGITSMFSTKFYIDLENILKTVIPKIEIITKKELFKVYSGRGFKGEMNFEDVSFKNYETRRSTNTFMMNIKQTSTRITNEFEELTSQLEKYCKEITPTKDSKYQIAKRMTK